MRNNLLNSTLYVCFLLTTLTIPIIIASPTIPGKPNPPVFNKEETSKTRVVISFSDPVVTGGAVIVEYEVLRRELLSVGGLFTTVSNHGFYESSLEDYNIITGVKYLYKYRCRNSIGWGEFSDEILAIAAEAPDPPNQISLITASPLTIKLRLPLTPTVNSNGAIINYYYLYMADFTSTGTTSFNLIKIFDAVNNNDNYYNTLTNSFEFEVTSVHGIVSGQQYIFYSTTVNYLGESKTSRLAVFASSFFPPKPDPLIPVLTDCSDTKLTVRWTAAVDAQVPNLGYIVEVKPSSLLDSAYSVIGDFRTRPDILTLSYTAVTANSSYSFRYKVVNINGESEYSDAIVLQACSTPSNLLAPVVEEISKSNIRVSWNTNSINTGGCAIKEFKIYVKETNNSNNNSNSNWRLVHYDYTQNRPTLYELNITDFTVSDIGNTFIIKYTLFIDNTTTTNNATGYDSASTNNVLLASKPSKPSSAPYKGPNNSNTVLSVVFDGVINSNGSEIISISLEIDDGNGGNFNSIIGFIDNTNSNNNNNNNNNNSVNLLTAIDYSNPSLVEGRSYRLRYRALNTVGYSDYSDEGRILLAKTPSKPVPVVIVENTTTKQPEILFSLPVNNGSIITSAEFRIKVNNAFTDLTVCNNIVVFSQRYCSFSYDLLKTVYLLDVQPIIVIFRVKNSLGFSEWSDVNITAILNDADDLYVKYPPRTPLPLLLIASQLASTVSISIPNPELDDTVWGRSSITTYLVEYKLTTDVGYTVITNTPNSSIVVNSSTGNSINPIAATITLSSLVTGSTYLFRYKLINAYGESDYSSTLTVLAQNIPSQVTITAMNFNTSTKNIDVTWADPYNGAASITSFEFFLLKKGFASNSINNYSSITGCLGLTSSMYNCSFSVRLLTQNPFLYKATDTVTATVIAVNDKGRSLINTFTFSMVDVSIKPSPMLIDSANTNKSSLGVILPSLPIDLVGTGNVSIISYVVEMRENTINPSTNTYDWNVIKGSISSPFTDGNLTYSSGITAGQVYLLRLAILNDVGLSEYSDTLSIKAAGKPIKMSPVVVSINTVTADEFVYFNWQAADNNGDNLLYYTLLLQDSSNNPIQHPECDSTETNNTVLSCKITMLSLKNAPFSHQQGNEIVAFIKATNTYGESALSNASNNNVLVAERPKRPVVPPMRSTNTDYNTLEVLLTSITGSNNGGSTILQYQVVHDNGTNGVTWVEFDSDSNSNFTDSNNSNNYNLDGIINSNTNLLRSTGSNNQIDPGVTYKVKYRARNVYGFSEFSDSLTIISVNTPAIITSSSILFSLSNSNTVVKITWAAPFSNGSVIERYELQLLDSVFVFKELTALCAEYIITTSNNNNSVNSSFAGIVLSRQCTLLMTDIRSHFGLTNTDNLVVKIRSSNSFDYSDYSLPVTSGFTIPVPPFGGLSISNDLLITNTSRIGVIMTTVSNNGGSDVLSYVLECDNNTNRSTWVIVKGGFPNNLALNYIVDNTNNNVLIVPGKEYYFRYRAYSVQGFSNYSNEVLIKAANKPLQPLIPSSENLGTDVVISINTDSNNNSIDLSNGDTITQYKIFIRNAFGNYLLEPSCSITINPNVIITTSNNLKCVLSMQMIITNYGFNNSSINEGILVKISAINSFGESPLSLPSAKFAVIQTIPAQPLLQLTRGINTTSEKLIVLLPPKNAFSVTTRGGVDYNSIIFNVLVKDISVNTFIDLIPRSEFYSNQYFEIDNYTVGRVYEFKYYIGNVFGWSTLSSNISYILGATVPSVVSNLSVSRTKNIVKIAWDNIASNGANVNSLLIELRDSLSMYRRVGGPCEVTNNETSPVIANRFCAFDIAVLGVSPFYLTIGDVIAARMRAGNSVGMQLSYAYSNTDVYYYSVPAKPGLIVKDLTKISTTSVGILVPNLDTAVNTNNNNNTNNSNNNNNYFITNTGGLPITDYHIEWDGSTDVFSSFPYTDSYLTQITETVNNSSISITSNKIAYYKTGIINSRGKQYRFRYKVENDIGASPFSDTVIILTINLPSPPVSVKFTQISTIIRLNWVEGDSGGSPITTYSIKLKSKITNSNSSVFVEVDNCKDTNTSNNTSLLVLNKTCEFSISLLSLPPLNYSAGDFFVVKIAAGHIYGLGEYGEYTSSVTVKTPPPKPDYLIYRNSNTSNTQLVLSMPLISDNIRTGFSPVTKYKVEYRTSSNSSNSSYVVLTTLTTYTPTITVSSGVISGMTYYYRFSVENIFGESEKSDDSIIIAAKVPNPPDPVVTSITLISSNDNTSVISVSNVLFTLNPASDTGGNGIQILKYKLFIKNSSNQVIEATECDETTLLSTLECLIPMTSVISKYALSPGSLIVAYSSAVNVIGESVRSAPNTYGVVVQVKPSKPINLITVNNSTTNKHQIGIVVPEITNPQDYGYSTILSYHVQWDQGINSTNNNTINTNNSNNANANNNYFVTLYGMHPPEVRLTDTRNGLFAGKAYSYRYRVLNIHGWSDFSDISVIYTGVKPQPPSSIKTVNYEDVYVKVSWQHENLSGLDITKYEVLFKDKNNQEVAELTYCNGENMLIIIQKYCIIPIDYLNTLLDLSTGDVISAKVRAFNIKGSSNYTSFNPFGAVMLSKPAKPGSLTSNPTTIKILANSDEEIIIKVDEITDYFERGGMVVISYNVQWDEGIDEWSSLTGEFINSTNREVTVRDILPGRIYKFRYRVKNLLGWGEFSGEVAAEASSRPDPVLSLYTENVNTKIAIKFVPPYNRGKEITNYQFVVVLKSNANNNNNNFNTNNSNNSNNNSNTTFSIISCEEDLLTIISTNTCTFESALLRQYPFNFAYNDLIVARMRSYNGIDWSEFSGLSYPVARMKEKPGKPEKPITNTSSYSRVEIKMTDKNKEPINGGSTILDYHLVCDRNVIDILSETIVSTELFYYNETFSLADTIKLITIDDNNDGFRYDLVCKYTIRNVFGTSEWSDSGVIEAANKPEKMDSVFTINEGGNIRFSYTVGRNNGAKITSIVVELMGRDNFLRKVCETSDLSTTSCVINSTAVLDSPHNLLNGFKIYASAYAINRFGSGDRSDINTDLDAAVVGISPNRPVSQPTRGVNSNTAQLEVLINSIVNTQNPVTRYIVEVYNEYSAIWDVLSDDSLENSYIYAPYNIVKGKKYKFRYKAVNAIGESSYSPEAEIQAASVPGIMKPPKVSYSKFNPVFVFIELTAPDDMGSPIFSYEVQALSYENEFITFNCVTVTCEVPLSSFKEDLINLSLGDLLYIRARARNEYGYSNEYSLVSLPLLIKSEPLKPTSVPFKSSRTIQNTNHNNNYESYELRIEIKELENKFAGYDNILAYEIVLINSDKSLLVVHNHSSLEAYYPDIKPNTFYTFIYRARNSFGWGPYSDKGQILSYEDTSTDDFDPDDNTGVVVIESINEYNYVPTAGPSTTFDQLEVVLENKGIITPDLNIVDHYKLSCDRHKVNISDNIVFSVVKNVISEILYYPFIRRSYSVENPGIGFRYDFYCSSMIVGKKGQSATSSMKQLKAGAPPSQVTNIDYYYDNSLFKVTYVLPSSNGSMLSYLDVFLKTKAGDYRRICHYSSDTNTSIVNECVISGHLLLDSPFYLTPDDLVNIYIKTANDFGESEPAFSTKLLYVRYVPKDPLLAPTQNELTQENQIVINISPVSDAETYQVWYSDDNVNWEILSEGFPDLTYVLSKYNFQLGDVYYFKYKTVNEFGISRNFSPVSSITISSTPERMDPPLLEYSLTKQGSIRVVLRNTDLNGLPVLSYDLKVKSRDGQMLSIKWCEGLTTICYLPISAFYDSPLFLEPGSTIFAASTNTNSIGTSQLSALSEGLELKAVPKKPAFPPFSTSSTNKDQIALKVYDLTLEESYGETVFSYNVVVKLGENNYVSLVGGEDQKPYTDTTREIIYTDIIPGKMYKFLYRARNAFGWSAYSDIGYVAAAQ